MRTVAACLPQNVRGCNLRKSLKRRSLEADTMLREVSTWQMNRVSTDFWSVVLAKPGYAGKARNGERGRNRTFNLLIKSSCATSNQYFSGICRPLDSPVFMRLWRVPSQPRSNRKQIGTGHKFGHRLRSRVQRLFSGCACEKCGALLPQRRSGAFSFLCGALGLRPVACS